MGMKDLSDYEPYKVMYIDAMNLMSRNYYGMRELEHHGKKTGMLYGVARLFIDWKRKVPGIDIVMVWEGKDSWRKAKYPIYKAYRGERSKVEATEFFDSVDRVKNVLPTMGIRQAWCYTYEADDVVSNLITVEKGKMLLSSGDWDWWEFVGYGDILYQHKDVLTRADMRERFEKKFNVPMIPFDSLWLFKVLCGDASDNVSGIPRFPKKLASVLCNNPSVTIDSLIDALLKMGEYKWASRVKANKWIIKRNVELIRMSKIPIDDIEWIDGEYSKSDFEDVLLKSGMENLYDRFQGVA
jgi:5'-3' exonuclease